MNRRTALVYGGLTVGGVGWAGLAANTLFASGGPRLLNASYDATRELYRQINRLFAEHLASTGREVRVTPAHGGSGSQARAVSDGLPADVVTLALWPDVETIRKRGLIADGWESRYPNRSAPYTSTIVFVVRKGNPHGVRTWDDLATKPDLRVVAANPKTSGAAKLAALAAWGSVIHAGGSVADAERLMAAIYRRVPTLESSSRAATVTFARKRLGDVQLTWENEAHLEVRETRGDVEVVYPPTSVLAEPHAAVVDAVVDRKGTRALAEEYVRFLYGEAAQAVIAANHFRPVAGGDFHQIERLPVDRIVPGGWPAANTLIFGDGGAFDRVFG